MNLMRSNVESATYWIPKVMVLYTYRRIHFVAFQCSSCGSCMNLEIVPNTYEGSSLECVRYNKLPTSCMYNVLSTSGVSPPSWSLTPDRKGVGEDLQSVMWNLSRRSHAYLAWDSLMPDASWLISSPRKKCSGPMSAIKNLSCRILLTATIVEVEKPVINND